MNRSGRARPVSPRFYLQVLAYLVILGGWCFLATPPLRSGGDAAGIVLGLLGLGIEVIAGAYVVSTLLKSLDYLVAPSPRPAPPPSLDPPPRVGVLYLCCDDLDEEAFDSLCSLRYDGPLEIIVHDDGRSGNDALRRKVARIAARHGVEITFLHRPRRENGKPGAVSYVMDRVGDRLDFLLFCDNDSRALEPRVIEKALGYFDDPTVAAVQFRGRGWVEPKDASVRRHLSRAIDVFDLFAFHQDRHGMMPFLGHNGLVRVSDLKAVGGLTPGLLSDDIDVSVRWYLAGKRVVYAREIEFAERAPGSYASFRLRTRKWAFGCAQVIRRHGMKVLGSRSLPLARRLGFLEFVGFYAVQVLLVLYLANAYVLMPALTKPRTDLRDLSLAAAMAGGLVFAAIIMPTLAYCMRERRLSEWPALAWTCCLVYGSTSFETCRGILGGFVRDTLEWIPTNAVVRDRSLQVRCWGEFGFGLLLLLVPQHRRPGLLAMPVSYLFVANYLFSPLIHAHYHDDDTAHSRSAWLAARRGIMVLAATLLVLAITAVATSAAWGAQVRVRGSQVFVDGRPFLLEGIHYSPWPPGTGPGKDYPPPDREAVGNDLDLISRANANAILIYDDAPAWVIDEAARRNLLVIQAFTINWQGIENDDLYERGCEEVLRRVKEVRTKPNLLAWDLGNEVTEWVYHKLGPDEVSGLIARLARRVREADPDHPITHSNWPVTKDLPLPFVDIVSFNLYPMWPREVVVKGYGEYIRDVLEPIAARRPLWITEFGVNTLESSPARQASMLAHCWSSIRRDTQGGVVFSFADEWWKNYDNPVAGGDYWKREYAPDDEKSHDLDPEEYYGIVDDRRLPKPAYQAVAAMYAHGGGPRLAIYFVIPLALMAFYSVWVFRKQ